MGKKFELDDIVLVGRTFEEYYEMFNLVEVSKNHDILDVASGVSSFCKKANLKYIMSQLPIKFTFLHTFY